VREQRARPLLVGIASVVVGLLLLAALGAPRPLVALVAAMAVGLATSLLVTLAWKISVHTAVNAGAVVILILVFGPMLLLLAPLVALVGWARVEVGDHTPAQVIGGATLGATIAAVVFPLLR
jgi:membrane-associated phospholipid phosphatase